MDVVFSEPKLLTTHVFGFKKYYLYLICVRERGGGEVYKRCRCRGLETVSGSESVLPYGF